MGRCIKNNKPKEGRNGKSGVYKLMFRSCPKAFIGQTGPVFKSEIAEY